MNNTFDLGKDNRFLELLEKMKEVDRLRFDYFKNLTIICPTAILFVFSFLDKIAANLSCWQKALLIISLSFFFASIVLSFSAMQHLGNSVLYLIGLQDAVRASDEAKMFHFYGKIDQVLKAIHTIDPLTKWPYLGGVAILLFLTAFQIFSI